MKVFKTIFFVSDFIFCSLLLISLCQTTFAQTASLNPLTNDLSNPPETFSQSIFSRNDFQKMSANWVNACDPDARYRSVHDEETLNFMSEYIQGEDVRSLFFQKIKESIYVGIQQLLKLNPHFFYKLLEKVKNKPLTLTCKILPLGALATHSPPEESPFHTSEINLDLVLHYVSSKGKIKHADLDKKNVVDQLILHEFLHFLGADNFSQKLHNQHHTFSTDPHIVEKDVINACTNQVYPTQSLTGNIYRERRTGFFKTQLACHTCVQARIEKNQVVLSQENSVLQDAEQKCSHIVDNALKFDLYAPERNPYLEARKEQLEDPFE